MKKETIETFMERYNLGGLLPKVKWKYTAADKTLHTRAAKDERSFVVDVVMSDFDGFGTEDLVLCIGDTDKVFSMMSPFGEDINVSLNKSGDRILGFSISDADCESYCTAADPSAMEPAPKNLQDIPDWNVEFPLTEDFLEKFLKARTALKDVKSFSVGMNKKGVFEIVIGYATANSNRIRITPATVAGKDKLDIALQFPIENMAAALKANTDIEGGSFMVNNLGICKAYFKNDKFTCTYYQFPSTKKL